MPSIDFATFCYRGDAHRLHAPGQLKKQVESNNYQFNKVIAVHQLFLPTIFEMPYFADCPFTVFLCHIRDLDETLSAFGIDINKPQYVSPTDKAHSWKYHVANHAAAIMHTTADYIVFADSDCWMIRQPAGKSWVQRGLDILQSQPDVFIVSPNDGEPERKTQVISQQMFMTRVDDFRRADFNQPGWDGNPHVPGGPFPEYWSLLEGRIGIYCKYVNRYRYVLGAEYRYWHFNKTDPQTDLFETDLSKW